MKRNILFFATLSVLGLPAFANSGTPAHAKANTSSEKKTTKPLHFKATPESLKQYKCPQWFRDAKFGIYAHWNVQSVPAAGEWYARDMYIQGSGSYNYHVKHYGHPSKFGYKDLIPLWKAEKFDPDSLVSLYKKAGAKYVVCMAVHHDNFDLWNSKFHRWNSVNMGPKKDIVGLIRKATLKQGLRFGVTTHVSRAYSWFNTNKGADKTGPLKGVPYDGNDPKYKDFYFGKSADTNMRYPLNPPADVRENWLNRMKDLIDNYHPDHFYLDGAIPFRGDDQFKTGMKMLAYYYNASIAYHGKLDSVMCIKDLDAIDIRHGHGLYIKGAGTLDIERGRATEILVDPWQTDNTLSDHWFHLHHNRYIPSKKTIHLLIDVVSKNGNLLLNVSPRADGTLDQETITRLKEIGKWIKINGESIYGTRPWLVYGEGPTYLPKSKDVKKKVTNYTPKDIRYTSKKGVIYAIVLGWPGADKKITLNSFAKGKAGEKVKVSGIRLLGSDATISWKQSADGLQITMPKSAPNPAAIAFKIKTN